MLTVFFVGGPTRLRKLATSPSMATMDSSDRFREAVVLSRHWSINGLRTRQSDVLYVVDNPFEILSEYAVFDLNHQENWRESVTEDE